MPPESAQEGSAAAAGGEPPSNTLLAPSATQAAVVALLVNTAFVLMGKVATEAAPLPTSSAPVAQLDGMANANVPLTVTGEPVIEKPVGAPKATLVTVPDPPPPPPEMVLHPTVCEVVL